MKVAILCSRTGRSARILWPYNVVHAVIGDVEAPYGTLHYPNPRSESDWQELVETLGTDYLAVSVGFMQHIPKTFFSRILTLNVHPGSLPDFKGKDPHLQALRAKAPYTAVTIHKVIEELDAGPVMLRIPVKIYPADYLAPSSLDNRLRLVGVYALLSLLTGLTKEIVST